MTRLPLLLGTAFLLGALHAFAPDHLAAVGVFVSRRPGWRRALLHGAHWGLGHSLVILVVGAAVALSGFQLPDALWPIAERVVGATLILLALAAFIRAARIHAHRHEHHGQEHWHVHAHLATPGHDHSHRALLGIGMLHGLAGSGALVVAFPVVTGGGRVRALLFLATFGIGTILSMSLFSALAGHLLSRAVRVSVSAQRAVLASAGMASLAVGLWWIVFGGQ